ncbi:hypothetical protein LTR66_013631 [Elasticomyces elasticus]|nr:hypothetical protein LTR66_013631 [Elasticomyces elasticus]
MTDQLTHDQCVLLTVHYASEANIDVLHALTPSRLDALDPKLVLRILLTYLPETVHPSLYTTYVREVASRLYLEQKEHLEVDISPVKDISPAQAQKRVKKLNLLDLVPPSFPPNAPDDLLTRFICFRAARIDKETGRLDLVSDLIVPFLDHNEWIRTWFISVVLPLLRFENEYYPGAAVGKSVDEFSKVDGPEGIDILLAKVIETEHDAGSEPNGNVARDIKGLVGPWMYGHTDRKRRKLYRTKDDDRRGSVDSTTRRLGRISLSGVSAEDSTGHDWEHVYKWMVDTAAQRFTIVLAAIEEWDGPGDVDLGGYDDGQRYLAEEVLQKLERQYAQAIFASVYAAEHDTPDAIDGAHGVLVRLAHLLDFEPPPDLATSVELLPRIDSHASALIESDSAHLLEPHTLLTPDHPLTTPVLETFMLLQMFVYSAYLLAGLGQPISITSVAKLRFYTSEDEQLAMLQKVLKGLEKKGKRDESQWAADRNKLLWLWNWGISAEEEDAQKGAGCLGGVAKDVFEKELLRVFVDNSSHNDHSTYAGVVEDVNPAEHVDSLAGVEPEELSFPFVEREED